MKLNRTGRTGATKEMTLFIEGQTFQMKDVLKANRMRFSRLLDGTPVWYRHFDNIEDLGHAIGFLEQYKDADITLNITDHIPQLDNA